MSDCITSAPVNYVGGVLRKFMLARRSELCSYLRAFLTTFILKGERMNKRIISLLLILSIFLAILVFAGCESHEDSNVAIDVENRFPLSYNANGIAVNVSIAEPLSAPTFREILWIDPRNYDLRQECDLIARAKVVNSEEICVEYIEEISRQFYGTVVTLDLQEVYYNSSPDIQRQPTRVTAYYELSSHRISEDGVLLQSGSEYYLFLKKSSRDSGGLSFENICDYINILPPTNKFFISSDMQISDDMASMLLNNSNDISEVHSYKGIDMDSALKTAFGSGGYSQ